MSDGPKQRIRITYVIGSLGTGGAEQQLVRLVNRLDRLRFQPAIVCLWAGHALRHELESDVPVYSVALEKVEHKWVRSRLLLGIRLVGAVVRQVHRHRPHVVHAYMPSAYVLGSLAAWLLRVPVIVAGRRSVVTYHIYPSRRWRLLARLANRVIKLHICNSDAVRRKALEVEYLPPEKAVVIPNGIDLPASQAPRPELHPEWGIRPGDLVAVSVANLIAYKGHETLLEATALVIRQCHRFRLVLIGDGPERLKLESQVEGLSLKEHVVIAGSISGAARLVPRFLFLVLASYHEGFPNALMEAMAAGVPVVASEVGGVPELVHDGVHGVLVPSRDPQALAAAMLKLLSNPELRARMGRAAREHIASHYSTGAMVEATQEAYLALFRRPDSKFTRTWNER